MKRTPMGPSNIVAVAPFGVPTSWLPWPTANDRDTASRRQSLLGRTVRCVWDGYALGVIKRMIGGKLIEEERKQGMRSSNLRDEDFL